jgi:alpha-1,3/alpha-1,6-mannosyltransferase
MSTTRARVAFVHPDLGIGGAERLVVDAAVQLQALGHDVRVVTSHFDPSHAFEATTDGTLQVELAKTRIPRSVLHMLHLPMAILQQLSLVWQVYVAARGRALHRAAPWLYTLLTNIPPSELPDVFVVDQLPVCIPLLQTMGARVLYYCHFPDKEISNSLAEQREKQGASWVRSQLRNAYRLPLNLLEEATTACADVIVANSRFTATRFQRTFPRLNVVPAVVHPAVDLKAYEPARIAAEVAALDLPLIAAVQRVAAEPFLLSINRFEAKKNVALALDTYARIRRADLRLLLVGGYDRRVKDNIDTLAALEAQAAALGLRHVVAWPGQDAELEHAQVIFLPSFPGAMLHALLAAPAAKALLYTPTDEHFGIVPLEAMVCGLPVIATNTGGPLETVVDMSSGAAGTGFLRPADAAQWAEAAAAVLAWDPATAARVGEAARQRVRDHFSVEALGRAMSAQVEVAHHSMHARRVQINVRTIALVFACATLWITMRAVMQATSAAPSRASITLVLVLAVAQPLLILGIRFV